MIASIIKFALLALAFIFGPEGLFAKKTPQQAMQATGKQDPVRPVKMAAKPPAQKTC